jgi:hypothetical protein
MSDEPGVPSDGTEAGRPGIPPATSVPREPRPMIERLGLAAVALVLGAMFGGVGAAAWFGGEPFLAVMGAAGCAMTLWVGGVTLFRG